MVIKSSMFYNSSVGGTFSSVARPMRLAVLLLATLLVVFPGPASAGQKVRVAVISDLNNGYGSTSYSNAVDRAVDAIIKLAPDLVISAGDMVAGQRIPHLSESTVNAMWQAFHHAVTEPLQAARIPLAVTPGNHDGSGYHGFEKERETYRDQWQQRKPPLNFIDDSRYPFDYAFEKSDVMFVSLDVTVTGMLGRDQKRWLRQLLEKAGKHYRYRVVFSHLPLWPFAHGRESEYTGDQELESILREGNVELYLSGHHHAFYPGFKDDLHLVSLSCLGSAPRKLLGTGRVSDRTFLFLEFDNVIRMAALTPKEEPALVNWQMLPEKITSKVAVIQRADLVSSSLKPLELSESKAGQ